MKEIRGHRTAVAKVRRMARENDGWMTPASDDPRDPESKTDYGNWLQEEIEGWEQTDHFSLKYGTPMADMAEKFWSDNIRDEALCVA